MSWKITTARSSVEASVRETRDYCPVTPGPHRARLGWWERRDREGVLANVTSKVGAEDRVSQGKATRGKKVGGTCKMRRASRGTGPLMGVCKWLQTAES